MSRAEAAAATGIQRPLAALHLDRLAEAGLVEVTLRRTSGRSGPGAGRPAKLYRRAPGEHQVSVPPRDYRGAAELLAGVIDVIGGRPGRLAGVLSGQGYQPYLDEPDIPCATARSTRWPAAIRR